MAFRPATGRKIEIKLGPRTVRRMIKEHLKYERKTITHDLAKMWNVHHNSAFRIIYEKRRPLAPAYVEAVIAGLKLDDFDANELRLQGAREAGWKINPKFLMDESNA